MSSEVTNLAADNPIISTKEEVIETRPDLAIEVKNLSKSYQIYERPSDRLKQSIMPRVQRLIGKEQKNYFQNYCALNNISFQVRKGETVGLVGSNGAGKSTLLQLICGTLYPTTGIVQTQGRIAALLELGSGFNPEFSGRDNVYLNASILGLSKDEIDAKYADILTFADIGEFVDHPVKTYSSGMMMRLAFSVIAHVDADILIVDEALAVGDAFFVQKCMRFIRKFKEKGTLLFVSHDTSSVTNLCDRAILLNNGYIERDGDPKDIAKHYLKSLYSQTQDILITPVQEPEVTESTSCDESQKHDMRMDFINNSNLRNDIELFEFKRDPTTFGQGGAAIIGAQITDQDDKPLSWVVGGENVKLKISCKANTSIESVIVGFFLNDRLGQRLFGDNTYLTYQLSPQRVGAGEEFTACFTFTMPVLPSGEYTITSAIADGTQEEHTQHHWADDILCIKSHSSSVCTGLIGIPSMKAEVLIND